MSGASVRGTRAPGRYMSDRSITLLAVAVWAGALVPVGSSWLQLVGCLGAVALAIRRRRSVVLLVGAMLLASTSAGLAWAGLDLVEEPTQYEGPARLVTDPQPVRGGVSVDVEIDGQRFMVRAWGSAAGHLRPRLMGEEVWVDVRLRPLGDIPTWMRARGLAGRGTATQIGGFDTGYPHTRLANSIRRTVESGAASLSHDEQSLYAGLVYGDDREQSALVSDNFSAAGLQHLLAVSGQNVAFVLAIAGPVLRRLEYRQRFVFVVAVLVLFATVTRFEPSVMRASVMSAVAAVAALIGSEVSGQRMLALAVAGLIVVEPLIVHSVAFQLSVAASAGILLWSGRVARALPGPRPLIESLAVTAAAQLAVAPLLIWRFDGLPVASLPSNLLAGPVAGPVMMWGLTGGLVAGLVPSGIATLLHLPTRLALGWIDAVASWAPRMSLGSLGAVHVVGLFVAAAWGLRRTSPVSRAAAAAAVFSLLVHPAIVFAQIPDRSSAIDLASTIWRDEVATVVQIGPSSRADDVLGALRSNNVGSIDLVIAERSSFGTAQLITWIKTRHDVAQVWAVSPTMGVGETILQRPRQIEIDGFALVIAPVGDALDVRVDQAP